MCEACQLRAASELQRMGKCRHHRYIFEEKEQKVPGKAVRTKRVRAGLQELGPRFTLKLRSLQRGTFDSKTGEFEYVPKAHANTSRRRFFL
jgi:ribosome production factor 1